MAATLPRRRSRDDDDDGGAVALTAEVLTRQCLAHGGYRTAALNTTLYLGHRRLVIADAAVAADALRAYTHCAVAYVDHNALDDLAAFAALHGLRQLYASHNALGTRPARPSLGAALSPRDGAACFAALVTLDVAHNALRSLNGLAARAPRLTTLLAADNAIAALRPDDLPRGLVTLDVARNALADEAATLTALAAVRATLRSCALDGNACVRGARAWRRRLVAALPQLRCLDGRPVDDDERACAEAFVAGGAAAEAVARAANTAAADARRDEQRRYCDAVLADARARRRQRRTQAKACDDDNDTPLCVGGASVHVQ